MIYSILSVIGSTLSTTTIILFIILSILTFINRGLLDVMYIERNVPKVKYYDVDVSRKLGKIAVVLLFVAVAIGSCKIIGNIHVENIRQKALENQTHIIIKEPEKKLNKEVFQYCLDKAGTGGDSVRACHDASMEQIDYRTDTNNITFIQR